LAERGMRISRGMGVKKHLRSKSSNQTAAPLEEVHVIIAEQKPFEEIKGLIAGADKVLVVGCGTCVTVCFAGGEKESGILATSLRMATKIDGSPQDVTHTTVQRQWGSRPNRASGRSAAPPAARACSA